MCNGPLHNCPAGRSTITIASDSTVIVGEPPELPNGALDDWHPANCATARCPIAVRSRRVSNR